MCIVGFFSRQPGTHLAVDNDGRGRAGMMRGGTMADILEDVEKEARADAAEHGLTRLVERVRWGFGGGGGGRKAKAQDGWGGGGGVQAAPLGFIEVRDGGAQYRRVHDPLRLVIAALLLPLSFAAAAAVMIVTLTALARSMKGMVNLPGVPWPFRRRRA